LPLFVQTRRYADRSANTGRHLRVERAEERLGSFEKFADAIHGLVVCEDIIGSLAAKRFHNSNKETEKAHAFQRFYANGGTKGREKGDQKSNSRAKKLEFGVGLA